MKYKILIPALLIISFSIGYLVSRKINPVQKDKDGVPQEIQKPLEKYSFENLQTVDIPTGTFKELQTLSEDGEYTSHLFQFRFVPGINDRNYKTTTGVINYPKSSNNKKYPVAILIRGYVDQKNYTSGSGTKNVGLYLAKNGFMTVAPDFLGYADSDSEAGNIFESRFQTYTTIISLIKSIENGMLSDFWDGKNLFIWGHSNGGQIAITTLEIAGENYPTVLWAPVSKPFPYSVLYYTDSSDDRGKLIRSELSKFEELYDVEKYSLTNYLDKITADIQLQQGSNDDAVPISWSDALATKLRSLGENVDYIKYNGADHNMRPDWDSAVNQTLEFFKSHLK